MRHRWKENKMFYRSSYPALICLRAYRAVLEKAQRVNCPISKAPNMGASLVDLRSLYFAHTYCYLRL